MVSIDSSYMVTPSDPTPSSILTLSLCDHIKLPNHGSQLFIYTANSSTSPIHTLATSLSKALTLYYPLSGRLRSLRSGRHRLLCNAKGALLIKATCHRHLSFSELCHFAPSHAVPHIDYTVLAEDVPLLAAQLTAFPCGTLTFGLSLCRALLDGASSAAFLRSWTKLAKGENVTGLDRDHDQLDTTQVHQKQLGTAIMRLAKVQVQKLKKKACDFETGCGPSLRPNTSFEVISGHLWRCVCKVRCGINGIGSQPTRLYTLVNCRNRLTPSLPNSYFGNATFPTVTRTCSFDDIVRKPLCCAVEKVREAIEKMNDEYVRSALDCIESVEDMDLFRDVFYNSGGKGREPNLYVVGWTNFSYLETDFGWGKPVCLLPGDINFDGKAFLLDSADGDGFVVAVCLQASLVDDLKKLFYENIQDPTSKL